MFVELTEAHLDTCAELFAGVFNGEPWNEQWTVEVARLRLADIVHAPGFFGLGMYIDGVLVGFLMGRSEHWMKGRSYYLQEMCVQTGQQRSGYGSQMITELERRLQERGVGSIWLNTMRDGQAEAFYAKNGYFTSQRMIMMVKNFK